MKVIVLADGDAPDRVGLDLAWPRWAEGAAVVVAADGGARHAAHLGLTIDTWIGDGDSIDTDALASLAASGVTVRRVAEAKDESDTELAVLEALARGADEVVILGALGGVRIDHTIANVGLLAMPQLGDLPTALLDERARIRLITAPGPGGAEVRFPLPGKAGDRVSLLPYGDGRRRRDDRRPGVPAGRRAAAARSSARPVKRACQGGRRRGRPVRPTAGHRNPCYPRRMSIPEAGDVAPEVALPDESGTIHRLSDQRGRWTILYFYPKDDTPGCTVEACEFRDANETIHERGADVWGVSPQGAKSKRAFREKFGLPFTLLADEEHQVAEAYGSWVLKENYGRSYWGTARTTFLVDPDGRIARTWPKVKPEGHAADVLAALDELQTARAH